MGGDEHFVSWNNHKEALLEAVKCAHASNKYTDVTLVAGGRFFPAHRIILGGCSEYFQMVFSYEENQKPFIVLDQPARCIESLLNYIYLGAVQIPADEIDDLVRCAQFLKVRGLYMNEEDEDATPSSMSFNKPAPPLLPNPTDDTADNFREQLRLSLAHADYLGNKFSGKPIIPNSTMAPPASTTVPPITNPINFGVVNPFGLNVVANHLFNNAANVRNQMNAFNLKPVVDDKPSVPRKASPPTKRKRVNFAANETELRPGQKPLPNKVKIAKTARANLAARKSPVNSTFIPITTAEPLDASTSCTPINLTNNITKTTTLLLNTAIPSTSTTTTTTAATAEELLRTLESQASLLNNTSITNAQQQELPLSAPAAPPTTTTAEPRFDAPHPATTEALNLMPQVKIEMDEDPDEQRQLDSVIDGPSSDALDCATLPAKTEPDDSDDQRLLVDDEAGGDDEGGHEGRSSSSSSSSSSQGTEQGSSIDQNGSSSFQLEHFSRTLFNAFVLKGLSERRENQRVMNHLKSNEDACSTASYAKKQVHDFLQEELRQPDDAEHEQEGKYLVEGQEDQHDDDGSSDDFPNLVMNVDCDTTDDKNGACTECGDVLANANLLRRHMSDKHIQERKHRCPFCIKSFKRKEHLDRHIRIHTGSKPFACHICNVSFTQKEHLKGHVENVHHKLGKKSSRNKTKGGKNPPKGKNPLVKKNPLSKLTQKQLSKLSNGSVDGNPFSISLLENQTAPGEGSNLQNGTGGLLGRMVSDGSTGSASIGDSMSLNLSNALNRLVSSQAGSSSSSSSGAPNELDGQHQQQRLALICSSSGNSSSPPMLTSPPALTQAPSHPLHGTAKLLPQSSTLFRPLPRPFAGSIIPAQGLVSILTLPNINNGGTAGPATTSFLPLNPISLGTNRIATSLGNSVFQANLPNTRFSSSSPTDDGTLNDDVPSISISNDHGSPTSEMSSSLLSSVRQITVVAGASGHVEAVVSPTRSSRRGRGRGRGGLGRGGRASAAGAKINLQNTKMLISKMNGPSNATADTSQIMAKDNDVSKITADTGPSEDKPASTNANGNDSINNSSQSQQMTALYAPVTRNSASSPEKHVQTVVLNIP